jgi:hypothetical protein
MISLLFPAAGYPRCYDGLGWIQNVMIDWAILIIDLPSVIAGLIPNVNTHSLVVAL